MKRLFPHFVLLVLSLGLSGAAQTPPLTDLRAITAVTNAQAAHGQTVNFQATVLFLRSYEKALFVQDGDKALYVTASTDLPLQPGDRVQITGTLRPSFHPIVVSNDISFLRHGELPKPLRPGFDELVDPRIDCRLVTLHGLIRSADIILSSDRRSGNLQLLVDGRNVEAKVESDDADALRNLLDAEVDATGALSGRFDGKFQRSGIMLHIARLADIKVLKRAAVSPWTLPIQPMDELLAGYRMKDASQRFHVRGAITYYQPGSAVVLQSGSRSLWLSTTSRDPLQVGDIADAIGFPDVRSGFLALTHSEVQDSHILAPVEPVAANWPQLASSAHIFDLVSIEGLVLSQVRAGSQDEYILAADGRIFTVIYRHPTATSLMPLPAMKMIPLGSRIRVTGICVPENSNPFDYDKAFNILIRSFDDIAVVADPPWLNMRTLAFIAGILLVVAIGAGMRSWLLERKVRFQTAALAARIEAEAALERRRGLILEDINGTRPLQEILKAITDLVSFKLGGAPCWCQIGNDQPVGNCPPEPAFLRIIQEPIPGRSETTLGFLHAGLGSLSDPDPEEEEALLAGAALAALAVETRRVYSDLRHRSEFDLLTDSQNRFSFERHLDALVEDARQTNTVFGLIFIDLDCFKDVNDRYGHHTGDLYLQEITRRMKHQLRSHDLLARLGGDEFGVLVPEANDRDDVDEIANRLKRCFDEPFVFDTILLRGSASIGIALYPIDGDSGDSLLSTADAAMYAAKNENRRGCAV